MTPKEAFEIYKAMPDDQKDRVLEIIGQLSIDATRWRLVEAVQKELKDFAEKRPNELITKH